MHIYIYIIVTLIHAVVCQQYGNGKQHHQKHQQQQLQHLQHWQHAHHLHHLHHFNSSSSSSNNNNINKEDNKDKKNTFLSIPLHPSWIFQYYGAQNGARWSGPKRSPRRLKRRLDALCWQQRTPRCAVGEFDRNKTMGKLAEFRRLGVKPFEILKFD